MLVKDCVFDPERDIQAVDPVGFIDLKLAFVNNCVPSQIDGTDNDYNGIENPESIVGTPNDIFEAIRMQSAVSELASKESETE